MILLAIISGLILTISFPPASISYLAFVGLVPIFISIEGRSAKASLKLGYIAGMSHYLTLLYWIPYPITRYGNIPFYLSIGPYILLCMYLSLFFALFCWLCNKKSTPAVILYPSYWIILEFLKSKILTGFPWCLLGYSQYKNIPIIQITDITGVLGISYLIVMANVLIYHLISKRVSLMEIALTGVFFASTYGYGLYRLNHPISGKEIKVAIVQGNIDQSIKWDPSYQAKTMDIYLGLTRSCYKYRPDLIVWPETAVPFYFQDDGSLADMVWRIPEESGASMIFGSPAYGKGKRGIKYYNRAYLISCGHPTTFYDKVHLVPFGEYVPLKKILFFLNRLVPAAGDFDPGNKIRPLENRYISAGVMICFDAIFPEIARTHTKMGANLLVNISNDAWFGKTSAPYQHLAMSIFRAVENRRSLIRATNTGISAFIDPYGRIVKRSGLVKREALVARVRLIEKHMSFYTCYGNIFLYVVFLTTIIIWGIGYGKNKKRYCKRH